MTSFEVVRSATVPADPARVHALINDFHEWRAWSPWEDVDPELSRTYSGPDAGVHAHYAWSGNKKAGEGSMEITRSAPDSIVIDLRFIKPFKAENEIEFKLTPSGADGTTTDIGWHMRGEQKGIWALIGKLYPMDKMVGKDFEKGLTRLQAAAAS